MSDNERLALERAHAEGDPGALARLQKLNDRSGLSGADADYLMNFLAIEEQVAGGTWTNEEGTAALAKLNDAFRLRVGSGTLREALTSIKAFNRGYQAGEADSWYSSSRVCAE